MNISLKLPEQDDFLRYAEGIPAKNPQVEKQIQKILASNTEARQRLTELRKDLYHIESQIPQYVMPPEFGVELTKIAQTWLQVRMRKETSFRNFRWEKELIFILSLLGAILLVIGLILAKK